jgi:hypothetical protein
VVSGSGALTIGREYFNWYRYATLYWSGMGSICVASQAHALHSRKFATLDGIGPQFWKDCV